MKHLNPEEQRAIQAWLANNEVTQCRLGESGIYDEFGDPLEKSAKAYRILAKKIRKLRGYERLTHKQIADQLGERLIDVRTTCQRHRIEVSDATAKVRARPRGQQ